jgi:hypothetical protein
LGAGTLVHLAAEAQLEESISDVEYLMSYAAACPVTLSSPVAVHLSRTAPLDVLSARRSVMAAGGVLSFTSMSTNLSSLHDHKIDTATSAADTAETGVFQSAVRNLP